MFLTLIDRNLWDKNTYFYHNYSYFNDTWKSLKIKFQAVFCLQTYLNQFSLKNQS